MKKFFSLALLLTFVLPNFASANNIIDLQNQIANLLAQVQKLQAQISSQTGSPNNSFCYTFNRDLQIGDRGIEISYLHTALEKNGFSIPDSEKPQKDGETVNDTRFGEVTASKVSAFQEKYRSEILTPAGLSSPTGYVGGRTRNKLNALCAYTTQNYTLPTKVYTTNVSTQKPTQTIDSSLGSFWVKPDYIDSGQTVTLGYSGLNLSYAKLSANCPVAVISPHKMGDYCNAGQVAQLEYGNTVQMQFINDSPNNQKVTLTLQAYDLYNKLIGTSYTYVTVKPKVIKSEKPDIMINYTYCTPGNPATEEISCKMGVINKSSIEITNPFVLSIEGDYVTINPPLKAWDERIIEKPSKLRFSTYGLKRINFQADVFNSIDESNESNNNHYLDINYNQINQGKLISSDSFISYNIGKSEPNPFPYTIHITNPSDIPVGFKISVPNKPDWLITNYATETLTINPGVFMGIGVAVDSTKVPSLGSFSTNLILTGNFVGSPISIPINLTVY